jgi:hydroxymethylpyrimidine kinase/phosphomethylpyrimidine kinase/thiamine-phosphate diphosphorylase
MSGRRLDLRLMLVTDPALTQGRGLLATVAAAVRGGVTAVQLRDKTASDAALAETAAALQALLAPSGVPLIVNDRPEVALQVSAAGVHLGQDDGDPDRARRLLGADAVIGWSVTDIAQLSKVPQSVDYIGFGPVFATATKPDAGRPLGIRGLCICRERTRLPIVAIGGIDARHAGAVMAAGADGIAAVSAICAAADPERAAAALRSAVDRPVPPNVLTIAGTDPSGGAGIQADLKTFSALGAYGMSAVTALVAQNTTGVRAVQTVDPDFVARQIDAVFDDVRVDAVKIGMVGTAETAAAVADRLRHHGARHIVLDPVTVAKSGDRLVSDEAVVALREKLVPLAEVITPNLPEGAVLAGRTAIAADEMEEAARALHKLGPAAVLLKGGHLDGPESTDILFDGTGIVRLNAPRLATQNTHGTGCTLSSAIAALLPRHPLEEAVRKAKAYLTDAIAASDRLAVGSGRGPVHHFHAQWK